MKAIYIRVSTEEQGLKGYSIGNQIDKCIEKAGTADVLQYIDEGWSGELLERPALNRLREDIENGVVTQVYCLDPDHLARKLMNQLILDDEFRRYNVELIFVNGEYSNSPEGKMFFSIRGAVSEFEKEKIKQRMKGSKIRKVKEGKVLGAYGLYGYDYDKETQKYVINEDRAKVVRMIFDYFTDPASPFKGINGIAKHLTELGIPTAKNKTVWHRQVVRQILMNESYTGKHAQNKYNTEGDYVRIQSGQKRQAELRPKEEWVYVDIPAIISEEQFEIAQELLKQSRRRSTKESQQQYLLSGLIRCSDCGNTMTGAYVNWWDKRVRIYTDKKNYAGVKHPGCGNQIKSEKLEEVVWEHVLSLLNEPEKVPLKKESPSAQRYQQDQREQLEKELEKIKKGRKNLISLAALSDGTDLIEIKQQLSTLKEKEELLIEKYNKLKQDLKQENNENRTLEQLKKGLELYMVYKEKEFPFEIKKRIIRTLVKQIYLPKEKEEVDIHLF